ncbi:hypothetical protein ACEQ6A_19485 [Rhizobium brockwellii]|uniref:hypothetical protein n=1 Tax=Rhizobium brockwellii TaxID=3019932 RepID=UPI003F966C3F
MGSWKERAIVRVVKKISRSAIKTMLAYGFQLVNAERRETNIFGVNGSKREISQQWRISSTVEPAAEAIR